jgi:hypothetical protein
MTFCIITCYSLYRSSSVAEAVRDILESDWLLFQMLQSRVANFTALAAKMKQNVEERIGSPVNLNSVIASLNRISNSTQTQGGLPADDKLPFGTRLSLSDSVFEMITKMDDSTEFSGMYEKLTESRRIPFGIFLSLNTCRFYIDSDSDQNGVEQEIATGSTENSYTQIKIDIPGEPARVPNTLIYEISKMLYKTHTDVHSAFFTPSGIVLVVENDKAAKVYQMLQESLTPH